MCFIYNLRSISQAGRRGFDPRLPLFRFSAIYGVLIRRPLKNGLLTG
jgi:hypothetical protein